MLETVKEKYYSPEMSVLVRGERALFTRPEHKGQPVTYKTPTCSALEGLLRSIYWKPEMEYLVKRVKVLNEVKLESYVTNGISGPISFAAVKKELINKKNKHVATVDSTSISQRHHTILKDVAYVIDFQILTNVEYHNGINILKKHPAIFKDIVDSGKTRKQVPYLGVREFMISERKMVTEAEKKELVSFYEGYEYDLGRMLFKMNYNAGQAITMELKMINGVIEFPEVYCNTLFAKSHIGKPIEMTK